MRIISYLAFCVVMLSPPAHARQNIFIEAIISDDYPLTGLDVLARQGVEVKTYNLDDAERWTANLETGLPPNEEQAKAVIESRFEQQGKQVVRDQITQAFQGQFASIQYGIDRYPAIVFDHGQAVVYGITDLNHALDLYLNWQKKNP